MIGILNDMMEPEEEFDYTIPGDVEEFLDGIVYDTPIPLPDVTPSKPKQTVEFLSQQSTLKHSASHARLDFLRNEGLTRSTDYSSPLATRNKPPGFMDHNSPFYETNASQTSSSADKQTDPTGSQDAIPSSSFASRKKKGPHAKIPQFDGADDFKAPLPLKKTNNRVQKVYHFNSADST
jgi:hypothetical protein